MASDEDIRAFIEQQRAAGAFDSSGQFSLDLRKAREKSMHLHEAASGAHALLWVQATNYLKPGYVRLGFESAEFQGEVPFGWQEFREILKGGERLPKRQRAFNRAIAACAGLAQEPAQVTYRHHQHGHFHLNLSTGETQQFQTHAQASDGIRVYFPRQGSAREHAEEVRQLEKRCGFSPSRPRYENRQLVEENHEGYRGRPPCQAAWNQYTHSSYLLAMRQWEVAPGHVGILTPSEPSQVPDFHPEHSVFLVENNQQGPAEGLVAIPLGLEGPGSVRLIYRGVLVEELEWDLGVPGAWAVVCADGLQTDLSGLKLVHDEALERLLKDLRKNTLDLAQHALAQLDAFQLPAFCSPQPGLLARLAQWAFPQHTAVDPRACREEIRRRITELSSRP